MHVVQTRSSARTIGDWYAQQGRETQRLLYRWYGGTETHERPRNDRFVCITTPVSLIHLLQQARGFDDIAYLFLDEIHQMNGLMLLICYWFCYLWRNNDPRVRHMRLVLCSATRFKADGNPSSPVIEAITSMLVDARLDGGPCVFVPAPVQCTGKPFTTRDVWTVCTKPGGYSKASWQKRGCMAAEAMV